MAVQFLLYVMTILLVLIFWELSKIHTRIKKAATSNGISMPEVSERILRTSKESAA